MTTTQSQQQPKLPVTEPSIDPVYAITRQPIHVDASSLSRAATLFSAQTNGSAAIADPLNSATSPKTTLFVFSSSTANPVLFDNIYLRMRMVVHLLGTPTSSAPFNDPELLNVGPEAVGYNSPPWNLAGALINQCKITINDSEIWSNAPGYFCQDWTARLLKNHTYDSLASAGHMLFCPIFDKTYLATTGRNNAAVDPGVGVAPFAAIKPATYDTISSPYLAVKYTAGPTAPVTQVGFTSDYNKWFSSPEAKMRAKTYITPNSHQRVITKCIPLSDLLPRFPPALITNGRSIKLEIIWTNTTDLLEHSSSTAATQAGVSLIGCDLITDTLAPSATQYEALIKQKDAGIPEQFGFTSTQVYQLSYTAGSDLIVPGITNFDSCMILQLAKGFANGQSTTNARTYTSSGQTLIFGNSTYATTGDIKLAADHVSSDALSITSAQIQYAGRLYPSTPITTSQTVNSGIAFDGTTLYAEYLKFCGKLSSLDRSAAIPYEYFCTTLPFIALRPYSDSPRISPTGGDLVVRLAGGTASAISVVVFRNVLVVIDSDGSVTVHK